MIIGQRVREIREAKQLTQAHMQERCGLLRCYVSRVENGHTIPTVAVLERMAHALEVPLYQLFYDGDEPARPPKIGSNHKDRLWGSSSTESRMLKELADNLKRMPDHRRGYLMALANRLASTKARRAKSEGKRKS